MYVANLVDCYLTNFSMWCSSGGGDVCWLSCGDTKHSAGSKYMIILDC